MGASEGSAPLRDAASGRAAPAAPGGALGLNSSVRLAFLGRSAVSLQRLPFWLLDFFGFLWILSSESRLINGLRRINRARVFRVASRVARGARGDQRVENRGSADWSWGKLNRISAFQQENAVRALPFRTPRSEATPVSRRRKLYTRGRDGFVPPLDRQALKWVRPEDLRSDPMPRRTHRSSRTWRSWCGELLEGVGSLPLASGVDFAPVLTKLKPRPHENVMTSSFRRQSVSAGGNNARGSGRAPPR
jgi:hypothetical protein